MGFGRDNLRFGNTCGNFESDDRSGRYDALGDCLTSECGDTFTPACRNKIAGCKRERPPTESYTDSRGQPESGAAAYAELANDEQVP